MGRARGARGEGGEVGGRRGSSTSPSSGVVGTRRFRRPRPSSAPSCPEISVGEILIPRSDASVSRAAASIMLTSLALGATCIILCWEGRRLRGLLSVLPFA